MKKNILTIVSVLIFTLSESLFAQNENRIFCGNDLLKKDLENRFPGFNASVNETFKQTRQLSKQNARNNNPYVVNVVVHVVYKNPEENLHDSIIQSQIDVLNEDYNRLNPDTADLRALFKPIAGTGNIQFVLSQIIRKQTTQNFSISLTGSSMPNQMKWDSLGGSTAIDPDHYLNIWVVKIQPIMLGPIQLGQVLGFAFPPAGLSNWPANSAATVKGEDGVVIDFRCFGRNNPNPISVDGTNNVIIRGRTTTHEVGHYLGLRHIWGDGGGLGGGGNNCNGNDGIDDTPKANNQSNFDCNKNKNTCVDTLPWTTIDAPDLIENFMDYASEDCMNMFTAGQVAHMRASLEGPRSGLLIPSGLNKIPLSEIIDVYPNPANEKIFISALNKNISGIELYNLAGALIYATEYPQKLSNHLELNVSTLNNGVYFIKIKTPNGEYAIKKITVKH